jgi:oligoendopeptidase F
MAANSPAAAAATTADPELQQAAWDLGTLVDGEGSEGVERRLAEALTHARAFAERYAGRLAELDSARLAEAMRELAVIHDLVGRAGTYAALDFSTDTSDPARGALLQRTQEQGTAIETTLLFFELEWAALPDERVDELLGGDGSCEGVGEGDGDAGDELAFCRHHLRSARRYREHLLSEPEEKILAEKSLTGASAWSRLFEELTSAIEVELPAAGAGAGAANGDAGAAREDDRGGEGDGDRGGEGGEGPRRVPLDLALSNLVLPDRELRRTTAEAITAALAPGLRTRAFLFNTLLADKATDDRLRRYPHWLAARNLANEASDESVRALIEAVRGRYEIARRWYRLKARLLGVERIADYDRMAAVTDDDVTYTFAQGREVVLDCYSSFSPELGALAKRFFDERYIDAPLRPGKRGGAFCASAVPSVHPYVLLNYTSRRRDVLTLAHELGHGVHFALAARQGVFHQGTPLTLAETASVFAETIVFGRLLAEDATPASRLALLAENLQDTIATVFRQVAMNRFEDLVHTARRGEGELSVERFGELWHESQTELLGDSVEITDGYRSWWSYIPHFIGSPGYVYAYAYGQLLALSVYDRYEQRGAEFVPQYLELLAAGGSRSPRELGAIVDVDLADPGFWESGLDLVERQLHEAEQAAEVALGASESQV